MWWKRILEELELSNRLVLRKKKCLESREWARSWVQVKSWSLVIEKSHLWNFQKETKVLNLLSILHASLIAQLVSCNAGDPGSIPELGRSPGEGIGSPLPYSGLGNSMHCIVHGGHKKFDSTGWLTFPIAFACRDIRAQRPLKAVALFPVNPDLPCVSRSVISNPMDSSPLGSSVHGILQARILEWVAIPFSRASSWPRDQIQVSHFADRFFTIWATREA